MNNQEFYIGWQPNAPKSFSKVIRKYLFGLSILVLSLGAILALSQKKFGTGVFEYGKLTEVKGIYYSSPVPVLKVNGKTFILVGYGKHGADGIIAGIEKEKSVSLDGHEVTFKGTLLYNEGRTILQIDKNDSPLVQLGAMSNEASELKDLGVRKLKGEIVDPKCYFGVMKPGEGKPHRDCAIRCILGGIPPVLHVRNKEGENNYYVIVGPHGEKMNKAVQDFVAEPTEIEGRLMQCNDWTIFYVNDPKKIERISYLDMMRDSIITRNCSSDCK